MNTSIILGLSDVHATWMARGVDNVLHGLTDTVL